MLLNPQLTTYIFFSFIFSKNLYSNLYSNHNRNNYHILFSLLKPCGFACLKHFYSTIIIGFNFYRSSDLATLVLYKLLLHTYFLGFCHKENPSVFSRNCTWKQSNTNCLWHVAFFHIKVNQESTEKMSYSCMDVPGQFFLSCSTISLSRLSRQKFPWRLLVRFACFSVQEKPWALFKKRMMELL